MYSEQTSALHLRHPATAYRTGVQACYVCIIPRDQLRFKGSPVQIEKQNLNRLKPGVNRAVHLFAASLLWTVIGSLLVIRGLGWVGYDSGRVYIVLALIAGTAKSLLILDKTAKRVVKRIVEMRDGTCLGAVYSWKTWMLVGLMAISGILLRTFFEPGKIIGAVYIAIGWALILSSRYSWLEWSRWVSRKD